MAAQSSNACVLPMVVQAYKTAGLLARALATTDESEEEEAAMGSGATPLHTAVISSNYENTVLLLKEYKNHCPEKITATKSGEYIM